MSWDVYVYKFDKTYFNIYDIPSDAITLSLGARETVQKEISKYFPGTDWRDPFLGDWQSSDGSIDFSIGEDEEVDSLALFVRANNSAVSRIVALVKANGWQAIDTGGEDSFLEQRENAESGLEHWREFRDYVRENPESVSRDTTP